METPLLHLEPEFHLAVRYNLRLRKIAMMKRYGLEFELSELAAAKAVNNAAFVATVVRKECPVWVSFPRSRRDHLTTAF